MKNLARVVDGIVVEVVYADSVDESTGTWIQTSFNTYGGVHYSYSSNKVRQPDGGVALRKNYAQVGYTYDATRDAFIPPKPYASWILNEDTCLWEAPIPRPTDLYKWSYRWNEEAQQWEHI